MSPPAEFVALKPVISTLSAIMLIDLLQLIIKPVSLIQLDAIARAADGDRNAELSEMEAEAEAEAGPQPGSQDSAAGVAQEWWVAAQGTPAPPPRGASAAFPVRVTSNSLDS
jgi:hypothetical protein